MGFDRGSASFRLFYLARSFDASLVERFAAHAAPPIETLGHEPIQGWVAGRHLLDTNLTEENCVFGGYLHATLMRAERRVSTSRRRSAPRKSSAARGSRAMTLVATLFTFCPPGPPERA